MSNTSQVSIPKNGGSEKKEEAAKPKTVETKPVEQKRTMTVEEIQKKTELINSLFTKRGRLLEAKNKLEKFHYGTDSSTISIKFQDDSGNSFSTGNRDVVQKMVQMVADSILFSLIEVDNDIKTFFE